MKGFEPKDAKALSGTGLAMADEQQAGSGEISDEQSQGASADGQQDASADGQRDQGRRASGVSANEQGADGQRRRQGRRASGVSADDDR